jgi:hypothetical protein
MRSYICNPLGAVFINQYNHPLLVDNPAVLRDFKIQYIYINCTDGSNSRKTINLRITTLLQRKKIITH